VSNPTNLEALRAIFRLETIDQEKSPHISLIEIAILGAPVALIGLLYILIFAPYCLHTKYKAKTGQNVKHENLKVRA